MKRAVTEIKRILEQATLKMATARTLDGSSSTSAAITSRYGDKYGDI